MKQREKKPIFEIIKDQTHIKIYKDGRVEGLEGDFIIKNWIPAFFQQGK